MEFRSIHKHGFARVAACTGRTAIGDPLANAEAILAMASDAAATASTSRSSPSSA